MNLKNFPKRLDSKTSCLRIAVPENLDLALEGLIRKVLREQPKTDDIYTFAAEYFETLLKIRDKAGPKFTAAQLCPFHNDEDAHEMIKLAGTFPKPASAKLPRKTPDDSSTGKTKKPVKNKPTDTKKTKPTVKKDKKPVKQTTPDLIKKLPTVTKPESGVEKIAEIKDAQTDHKNEESTPEVEEEFLTSDPIKELVEKELMMEKAKNKTDANEKTEDGKQNTQQEEKPLENTTIQTAENPETKKPEEGSKETTEKEPETKTEETENGKPPTELSEISEEGTKDTEPSEKITTESENSPKEKTEEDKETAGLTEQTTVATGSENGLKEKSEEDKETVAPTEETTVTTPDEKENQKSQEGVLESEKLPEKAPELEKPVEKESKPADKKEEENKKTTHKEETFPVSDSGKKVTDVLPSEKLPDISEDVAEKNQDISQPDPEQAETPQTDKQPPETIQLTDTKRQLQTIEEQPMAKDIEIPAEKQPEQIETEDEQHPKDNNTQQTETVTKPVEETPLTPEQKSLEISPVATTPALKGDIEKENLKTEETTPKDIQPTAENTQTEMKEPEEHKKNSESAKQDEQPNKTTEDEPKPKDNITLNEDKTFGEIIKNTEEPEDIKQDEAKPEETKTVDEKIPEEATTIETTADGIQQEAKTEEKITPVEATTVEETTADDNQQETKIEEKITPTEATTVKEMTADDKQQETKIEEEKTIEETITEDKRQETSDTNEKPPTEPENKTPNISNSGEDIAEPKTDEDKKQAGEKQETTNTDITKEPENQETQNLETEILTKTAEEMTATPEEQPEVREVPKEDSQIVNTPTEEPKTTPEEPTTETEQTKNEEQPVEELCTVVDNKHIPKEDTITTEKTEAEPEPDKPATERTETVDSKTEEAKVEPEPDKPVEENTQTVETKTEELPEATNEPEEQCTVVDVQSTPKEGETDVPKPESEDKPENTQTKYDKQDAEELCMVVDNQTLPKDDEAGAQPETANTDVKPEPKEEQQPAEDNNETKPNSDNSTEDTERPKRDTEHIITVEEVENPTKPDEVQIKTIQTHYYDTLQVPETVTREYRVHNIALPTAAGFLGAATFLQPPNGLILDENMNDTTAEDIENLPISPPAEENTPEQVPVPPLGEPDVEADTQKTESDDLLDLMTPTSGYSMNLSDISLLTVSELFLDSEKRYSSVEKEETRYVTPKTDETTDSRQEVEEVIEKTVLPTSIHAVPVPPREAEEINEETTAQIPEKDKKEEDVDKPEKDKMEEKPENGSTEGSSNGRSVDSDIPFISVEVKTVIETQVLDDDEEEEEGATNGPEVEVKVRATIDVQDDAGMSQPQQESVECPTADGKSHGGDGEKEEDVKGSVELERKDEEEEERKGSCSTGVEGSSSIESDVTGSSAATEIKRTDSAKRNSTSVRSLVSAQSLDLGKRNPLLKTRSLSTFRHGVTDFEVWNKIEKELEDAAIKIQSKFRGYKTRKKLQRENAVQITTEESSVSTTPVEAEAEAEVEAERKGEGQQSTGEFHDSIILSEHPL